MKNKLMALVEAKALDQFKEIKIKEKDKEGKETERTIVRHLDDFQIGDTVDVHQRILEGAKERVQVYTGVVIARKGEGARATFTVRRVVQSEGVERVFPLNSPRIAKVEVKRTGRVRRAKLYYLRDRVGKATRLRERRKGTGHEPKAPKTEPAAQA